MINVGCDEVRIGKLMGFSHLYDASKYVLGDVQLSSSNGQDCHVR